MKQIYRRAFVGASAASIGIGIGQAMPFPHAHWAVIGALTLLMPGAEGTLGKTAYRTVGTLFSMALVVALFSISDPQPRFMIPGLLLAIGCGFFLMRFTRYRYAVFLAFGLGPAFGVAGLLEPGAVVDRMAYWTFHICVGCVLVMIMTTLFRFRDEPGVGEGPVSVGVAAEHALRVGLASILCLLAAAAIERPEYASPMLITVVVLGMQPSFSGSRTKAKLRLMGALGGGALAVLYYVFVLDSATSVLSLMSATFVVIWFCGIIIGIRPIAYLGYQIGMVFAWSIGDTNSPVGDVWAPLLRTGEVFMGSALLLAAYSVRIPEWRWLRELGSGRLAATEEG